MSTIKHDLDNAIAELGLVVTAEFVPYSKSRSAKPNAKVSERSLNWKVRLSRMAVIDGSYKTGSERSILETDYTAGIAHCPSYPKRYHNGFTIYEAEAIEFETERGKKFIENSYAQLGGKPILPDTTDVIYSLVSDADVLDYSTFENWASDMGYDVDSRKAEATYRECLKLALALRNGIGEDGLKRLREASQDY